MLERVQLCYERAVEITGPPPYTRTPYVLGGGHPGFGPSIGQGELLVGYDCSGFGSSFCKAGGILAPWPGAKIALTTDGFMRWGRPGQGMFLTIWIRNDADPTGVHHIRLDFHNHDSFAHRFAEAPHPGADCWWFDGSPTGRDFDGYVPLHWPGT